MAWRGHRAMRGCIGGVQERMTSMKLLKQPAINAGARVIGYGGSKLGTVQQPIHDPESGELTAFTVRCGIFGRKNKLIPAERIKQIMPGTGAVIVRLDKKDLQNMLNAEAASSNAAVEVSLPRPAVKDLDDGA